jgi:hypothetical protein
VHCLALLKEQNKHRKVGESIKLCDAFFSLCTVGGVSERVEAQRHLLGREITPLIFFCVESYLADPMAARWHNTWFEGFGTAQFHIFACISTA